MSKNKKFLSAKSDKDHGLKFPGVSQKVDILYEDDAMIAIHKPVGLLVHRGYLARRRHFFALGSVDDKPDRHMFPVHRLDRFTSGVLLFAKSSEIAGQLRAQFATNKVEKSYIAIVKGHIEQPEIIDPESGGKWNLLVDSLATSSAKNAQNSSLSLPDFENFCPSESCLNDRYSLVRLVTHNEEKHQLRLHLAHLGHPVVGDTTYGDDTQKQLFGEYRGINRLWLIVKKLKVNHPQTGIPMAIETELEPEWLMMFERLGWNDEVLQRGDSQLIC